MKNIVGCELTAGEVDKITNFTIESIKKYKVDLSVYDYIKEKVRVLEEYNKFNPIKNYVGMLIDAIKENWKIEEKERYRAFNDYEQRDYSPDQWNNIENRLLGWDKEE